MRLCTAEGGGPFQRFKVGPSGELTLSDHDDAALALQAQPKAICVLRTAVPLPQRCTANITDPLNDGRNGQCAPGIVSGIKNLGSLSGTQPSQARQGVANTLKMSSRDTNLTIRIYIDRTMAEVYWQGGRTTQTLQVPDFAFPQPSPVASMGVASSVSVELISAQVWAVEDMWVSPEEVLATPFDGL